MEPDSHDAASSPDVPGEGAKPALVLVNPCVLDNFPVPRLNLSTAYLASHIRKSDRGRVTILDMQLGLTVEDVVAQTLAARPHLVGISVSFGQLGVARQIASRLRARNPRVGLVFGNVVAALGADQILSEFPDSVVATGQGEITMAELCDWVSGKCDLSDVAGISYVEQGALRSTLPRKFNIDELPPPALDTLPGLRRLSGALTAEFSRGCQYGACTFCPRDHKARGWQGMSAPTMLRHFEALSNAARTAGLRNHIFLADEEFVGREMAGLEVKRIVDFAQGLLNVNNTTSWDTEARVDQVYRPDRDLDWHVSRLRMWDLCHQAGLERLFMGIESGSEAQLRRYGKGSTINQNLMAIRLLSGLGIPLRFGFITFDPLMEGLGDLKANLRFLGRTDAFLKPDVSLAGNYEGMHAAAHDESYVRQHAVGVPIYSGVSYMGATLEVLLRSPYHQMVLNFERETGRKLIRTDKPVDLNMARYEVAYADPLIGHIAEASQRWIDRNFAVAYTLKSLHKSAPKDQRATLMGHMVKLRECHYELLAGSAASLDRDAAMLANVNEYLSRVGAPQLGVANDDSAFGPHLMRTLETFQVAASKILGLVESDIRGGNIGDNGDQALGKALSRWQDQWSKWMLLNGDVFGNLLGLEYGEVA